MGNFGGKQPGAGRPRREDKHLTAITRAEKQIADRLPALVEKMFELAEGVMVDGGGNVYKTAPDMKALAYLVDRIMGKAATRIDHERWAMEREAIEEERRIAEQRPEAVDETGGTSA